MIPHLSIKPKSMKDIVSGKADGWIKGLADGFNDRRSKYPTWLTLHHEPEDNFASAAKAKQYRAAVRYFIKKLKSYGVTNVAHAATVFMTPYTFITPKRDWRRWYPDWKGTTAKGSSKNKPNPVDFYSGEESIVDINALDSYHRYCPTEGQKTWVKNWLAANIKYAHKVLGWTKKPYTIGEWGTIAKQTVKKTARGYKTKKPNDQATAALFVQMLKDIQTYDVRGINYWNSHLASRKVLCGSAEQNNRLDELDPHKIRWKGLAKLMDSKQAARWRA
jgi:hypothetical protein